MKRVVQIICGLLVCLKGMGQIYHGKVFFGYSTSGAYSRQFTDAFSFTANPACLGNIDHLFFGTLAENKWMLESLNSYALAASFPLGGGGVGIALQQSGDADFSEQGLEMAYGKNLGKLDIGICFDYLRDRAATYGSVHFISCSFGMRFRVNEKLYTGWELGLPFSGLAGKTNTEKAPQFFRMGFGYAWLDDLSLSLQIEKQSGQPVDFSGWLDYRYGDHFIFSFGISPVAGSAYFKTGWKKNRLCIQTDLIYEPVLGFSPGLVLLWEAKNKKE
jgi:hypothetical protein